MQAVLVALQQQLLAAQPTTLASVCEEADTQLEERTGAPELADGIGHRWPLKEFIILFIRGPKWVPVRWSWCRLHACHTVAAKQEFWQLGTSLQFAVLEKLSCAVPDEHSVHLHCMHLFKRHKYLLFIDSLKLPHCSQLILGYKSVQQLYNFFFGSTTYLGGKRRRH